MSNREETVLFKIGKVIGISLAIAFFSAVASFLFSRFTINISLFLKILIPVTIMVIIVQGSVKKRWL